MRAFMFLFIALLLAPTVLALQFLTPSEGQTYVGTTAVTFTWDETNVTFSVGSTTQEVNGTSTTVTLSPGMHTATITKDNATTTRTVIVSNAPTQTITITTDKQAYEAGESSRIRLVVTTPGQINLTIHRNNQVVDMYTVNVQSQTDFLYPLTTVGSYSVLGTGQDASTAVSFTVVNTTLGASIGSSTTATAGRTTAFTSIVNGGTTPYSYFWQFSDNTTSTDADPNHVFAEPGNYTVQLLVKDVNNKQATAQKSITITPEVYDLDVTVMTTQRKLMKDVLVVVTGTGGGKTEKSNSFGEASFNNLAAGTYTVNVSYNYSGTLYVNTTSITLDEDEDLILTLGLPVETPAEPATLTTPTTTSTPTAPATASEEETVQPPEPAVAKMAAVEDTLEIKREETRTKLKNYQESMLRSEEKRQLLSEIGLLSLYDEATAKLATAQTETELNAILLGVPQEVTVLSKDTLVEHADIEELEPFIAQYIEDTAVTSKELKEQYNYNIELVAENVTFTLKRTVVRVVIPDGSKPTVYTVYSRSIQAPAGMTFAEYLPQGADVDTLKSAALFEQISDSAVLFETTAYSYVLIGDMPLQDAILPVPSALAPVPKLLGFVTVKLQPSSFTRGPLYAILLGILIAVGVASNVMIRRRGSVTEPFAELAELTISLFEAGNHAAAAKYIKEVETVHASLPKKDQQETLDILIFIKETSAVHTFRASADHVTNLVMINDAAGLPAAYERLVQQYESLSAEKQQQEQEHFERAHTALERHLSMQEE